MTLDDDLSKLIGTIYAGAYDAPLWHRAMNTLATRLDAGWLMVAVLDSAGCRPSEATYYGAAQDSRFADGAYEYYAEELYRIDPVNKFAASHLGGEFDSRDIADPADYLAHPYVAWNRARLGSSFWRSVHSPDPEIKLGVSIHHNADNGPLSLDGAKLLRMLFSHMDGAIRLAARPPVLDGPEPMLLLDRRGMVAGANEAARKLIDERDALEIVDSHVRARDRRSAASLDRAIASALSIGTLGGAGGAVALSRNGCPALLATVSPLPQTDTPLAAFRPAILIRLVNPVAPPPPIADLKALFGLTAAEIRLSQALLAADGNLRDIAVSLGIAYSTARVQLASIFDKTGVCSQVQLTRLLMRLSC
jgi:DNA-binding CsgD family transcriptional regulator